MPPAPDVAASNQRERTGELIGMDGSKPCCFKNRRPECTLFASIAVTERMVVATDARSGVPTQMADVKEAPPNFDGVFVGS